MGGCGIHLARRREERGGCEVIYNISLPGLLVVILAALIWVVPMWRLLPQYGYSKWISLIAAVPVFGSIFAIVLLWVLAFSTPKGVKVDEVFN